LQHKLFIASLVTAARLRSEKVSIFLFLEDEDAQAFLPDARIPAEAAQ
jgi:hypothetical protein